MLHELVAQFGEVDMDLETLFSIAGLLAMGGWLTLLASPLTQKWSQRIGGQLVPLALSFGYVALSLGFASGAEGGFGTLAEVGKLFSRPEALLAGWVHFLAFDLLIGAWICRTAKDERVPFLLVIPCLFLTFLLGPAGFLACSGLRIAVQATGKREGLDA